MSLSYWAVRPARHPQIIRIEKAASARQACALAFGRGVSPGDWEAKNLGSQIRVVQSDSKRIAMLKDEAGWEIIK